MQNEETGSKPKYIQGKQLPLSTVIPKPLQHKQAMLGDRGLDMLGTQNSVHEYTAERQSLAHPDVIQYLRQL